MSILALLIITNISGVTIKYHKIVLKCFLHRRYGKKWKAKKNKYVFFSDYWKYIDVLGYIVVSFVTRDIQRNEGTFKTLKVCMKWVVSEKKAPVMSQFTNCYHMIKLINDSEKEEQDETSRKSKLSGRFVYFWRRRVFKEIRTYF